MLFQNSNQKRKELIKHSLFTPYLPRQSSTLYVYPSRKCSGKRCLFCIDNHTGLLMPLERVEKCLQLFKDSQARKLTISGGGEPMDAPEQVLHLFQHIPNDSAIELHSCGLTWAGTHKRATAFFDKIEERVASRGLDARIRMSIGKFVQNKVPLYFAVNAIQAYEQKNYSFRLFFNMAYLETDPTLDVMQNQLGASRSSISQDKRRQLLVTSKNQYTVRFTNLAEPQLVLTDEEYDRFLNKDGIVLTIDDKVSPLRQSNGDYVMGTSYNDVCGEGLLANDGLALTVDTNGDAWLFLGSVPDHNANVDTQDFTDICTHFEQDPLTWSFLNRGVETVARAAALFRPELFERVMLRNDPVTYVFEALFTAELRWGTTLVVLYELLQDEIILKNQLPSELQNLFSLKKQTFREQILSQYKEHCTKNTQEIPEREGTGGRGPSGLFIPSSSLRDSLPR